MSARLPEDILAEILKQLPVKSLLRFRSVLRSWNSLITSRWFITLQLNRPVESTECSIILSHDFPRRPLLIETVYRDNGRPFTKGQELEFPIETSLGHKYVGACNGLLCFSVSDVEYVYVIMWNPSIRTCFQVPIRRAFLASCYFAGFGFDCRTSQYKVLKLIYAAGENYETQILPQVEVFVLGTDTWRRVDIHVPFVIRSSQACLHGAIHWIASRPNKSRVILVFDVHEEVFREIETPSSIIYPNENFLSITVCAHSLCLLEHDLRTAPDGVPSFLFIWVMKQYGMTESWTKQFSIDMRDHGGLRMLGFRKHDKILFVNGKEELVSYDPKSGRVEQLGLQGLGRPLKAIPFTESLAGLEEQVSSFFPPAVTVNNRDSLCAISSHVLGAFSTLSDPN